MAKRCAALVMGLLLLCPGAAIALDIIDTGGMAWESSYAAFSGADTAGGTFTATEDRLQSFTLWLGVEGGVQSNSLRAVVTTVDGSGMPTGTVIWESADFEAILARQEYLFLPDLSLSVGTQYFIGVDSGLLTTAAGGDFTIQASAGPLGVDLIPGGEYWSNSNGVGWAATGTNENEVRTTITMVLNPEPTTGALLGFGLFALGLRRRKSARAA